MKKFQNKNLRTCAELGVCTARPNCGCTPGFYFAPGTIESSPPTTSRKEKVARFVLILAIFIALGFSTAMAVGGVVWGGWGI